VGKPPETAAGRPLLPPETGAGLLLSLSTRSQLDEIEGLRITEARVWAMRRATLERPDLLTEAFCRELHRRMFGGIWRTAGRYRIAERAPGWEAARIPQAVAMFLDDAEGWIRFSSYPVHEAAVRLHHRLAAVQPWAVGNGRHARLLADVLVASQGEAPLGWGRSLGRTAREAYGGAMRSADGGDVSPLVAFARS
jgi:Fic-DOC domain mobile mystery protein B